MHIKTTSIRDKTTDLLSYHIVVDAGLGLGAYFEFCSENYIVTIPLYLIKKFIAVLLVNS